MPVEEELFREIMAAFPTGVTVVSASDPDGTPRGLTVSAFCPVSLHPPMVLVCVDKTSNTLPAIQESRRFVVNLLASERHELAVRFASKSEAKFEGLVIEETEAGPLLAADSVAHVICTVENELEAGDHWIFVGRVQDGAVDVEVAPLVYGRRTFTAWAEPAE